MLHFLDAIIWALPTFVLIMGIVVFVHEFGHYTAARLLGVKIIAFSLGMGKEIAHHIDKNGVRWRIGAFPIGGYVKFLGDEDPSSTRQNTDKQTPGGLNDQPLYVRACVVAAGPLSNILLAFILITGISAIQGRWIQPPLISAIMPHTPADAAGLKAGDLIVNIDNVDVPTFIDLMKIIQTDGETQHTIGFQRENDYSFVKITPEFVEIDQGAFGRNHIPLIGIQVSNAKSAMHHETCSLPTCAVWAANSIVSDTNATFAFFKSLILGRQSTDGLSGPIGIATSAGSIAKAEPSILIVYLAAISLSIGIMNLLPIPLLDGGHLALYLYEAVVRRPPPPLVINISSRIGLSFIVALFAYTTVHDILKHVFS